jgi:hypothetical protein
MQSRKAKTREAEGTLIMTNRKRKLTAVEKAERKLQQQEYMTIFIIDPAIKHLNMSLEHKQPWGA